MDTDYAVFKPQASHNSRAFSIPQKNLTGRWIGCAICGGIDRKCEYNDFLDQALCHKLVCGLQNETKLLAELDLTLKQAFEIIQGMEAAHWQTSELQVSNGPRDVHSITASISNPVFAVRRQTTHQKNVISDYKTATTVGKLGM